PRRFRRSETYRTRPDQACRGNRWRRRSEALTLRRMRVAPAQRIRSLPDRIGDDVVCCITAGEIRVVLPIDEGREGVVVPPNSSSGVSRSSGSGGMLPANEESLPTEIVYAVVELIETSPVTLPFTPKPPTPMFPPRVMLIPIDVDCA